MKIYRKPLRYIAFLSLLLFAPVRPIFSQSPAKYTLLPFKNELISMRDGAKLVADIYRPSLKGVPSHEKFPTILVRTPYNRAGYEEDVASTFVPRGYVVVIQSVRGRYGSEGRWRFFRDDSNDGFDTAAWIAAQSWSDGSIGTLGGSYDGGTQFALALAHPPALKAMVPLVAASNPGLYGIRHHGAFELRLFSWIFSVGNPVGDDTYVSYYPGDQSTQDALAKGAKDYRQYVLSLPFRPGTSPLHLAPDYESTLVEMMAHGDYDAFWKDIGVDVVSHLNEIKDVPMLHLSGWYDSWSTDVADLNYPALARSKKSPQQLIMGPWTHGGTTESSFSGEADFGPSASLSLNDLELSWMDRWLKGIPNAVEKQSPVRIFVMGGGDAHKTPEGLVFVGGVWRNENEWPLKRAVATPYYFRENSSLSPEKPTDSSPQQIRFDPKNPVPSIGGNVSSQQGLMQAGAYDQRCRSEIANCPIESRLSSRNDVLTFESEPLKEPLEVTGPVVVTLWASSDALDTDFTAKLVDVYPPNKDFPQGVELNVVDSIIRARYRDSLEHCTRLVPGKIYRFQIELGPTSLLFPPGHRIRVDISSSNFPRFDVNPNTGEALNQNRATKVAINTIYHDAAHPSAIVLPIIPSVAKP